MPSTSKQSILLLFPGPKYDLDRQFGERLALLSRDFEGEVLTSGSSDESRTYDSFCLRAIHRNRVINIRFALFVIGTALRHRLGGRTFDLVVSYDPIKTGILGIVAARILKAKMVTEVNGDYAEDIHYVDEVTGRKAVIKKALYGLIIRFVLLRCSGIKTLYPGQLAPFRKSLKKGQKLASFHDYINLQGFSRGDEEKIVLLAGFPFYVKGVDILISAFKSISDRHPDWRLKILGWYPNRDLLDRHIAEHPKIEFHQAVHHRDMPDHVGRAGICVLASRTEGMGRFLIEAMTAGKPRIGTRIGGIPQIIEPGVDGLLFDAENREELAACLDLLMGDSALRQRLGEAAQRRSLNYGTDSYYRQLRNFYFEVLGQPFGSEATVSTES
ncbi:glycosyltransferase family 4 protein [Thiohalomonas denitrificans]|uniref:Glycosyltransferase involved in cell wall bisynthesis n=1 Tax=Thiohalomonas denitrificans TaxID=415747 RepID=A0A1G5Q2A0_9GAMM|nr:glycosyltransferase family 4 protein [Thiohalomonas denitrificans]SCZ55943.1 Glycosyltransferase involved in cell wall bisynthesis [Thiohalomonas denitrificans]